MRLAALIAAAALGTGCYYSDTGPGGAGDLNVFWAFRRAAPAQPGGAVLYDATYDAVNAGGVCPQSDVDHVTVSWPGGATTVACTGPVGNGQWSQGVVLPYLAAGSWTITVTGWRSGTRAYESSVTATVYANRTNDALVDVFGVPEPLEVYAYLADGVTSLDYQTCAQAGWPNVAVQLWDSYGTLVEDLLSGCGDPLPTLAFSGPVDRDGYTLQLTGYAPSGGAPLFEACASVFDHYAPQVGAGGVAGTLWANRFPSCP